MDCGGVWIATTESKCRKLAPSKLDRRNGLDLDHEIRAVQLRYLDQRHGGCGGWRNRSKESVTCLAIGPEVVHVGKEHRQLDQIGCGASARLQGNGEVAKHLSCLRSKIASADDI